MKLTIHIGSHKAGSTAIQQACSRETQLLGAAGILYPVDLFPRYPNQHSELAALIERGDDDAVAEVLDRTLAAAAERGLTHVFLSGEDLCSGAGPDGIARLARVAGARFETIAVVLVLRRKAGYLLSHYNHFLRHSAPPVGAAEFRRSVGFSPRRTVERWSAAFGPAAVRLVAYDDPPGGPSMLQRFFAEVLGVALGDDAVKANARVNASFDFVSAVFVNEAVKMLPGFDLHAVNLAYLEAFRTSRGRMPKFEGDLVAFLDSLFPDEDWRIEGLPDLCGLPPPGRPLDVPEALGNLEAMADFFGALQGLFGGERTEAQTQPARRSEVIAAYRSFLGRSPSTDELMRMTRSRRTMPALRQMFVDSPEFRRRHRERLNVAALDLPPLDVEVAASEAQQLAMFDHLKGRWTRLGAEKAHWSVWSEPEFKGAITPKLEEDFYKTGAADFQTFRQTLARAGRAPSDFRRLVDFGCGLGRFTIHAARELPAVVGVDFSANHLKGAAAAAAQAGVDGVRWVEKTGIGPDDLGPYDLWHSRIVLQHNPPSLIDRFLRFALAGLAEGGVAVFQVPTYSVNYNFHPADYLARLAELPEIEMHCLPQPFVLRLIEEAGCRILEIREDNSVDIPRYWVSNTFVVEKRRNPGA